MRQFRFGSVVADDKRPALVVAEIGINHGGSLDDALEMADAAIDAGAHLIKHQTHIPDEEMSEEARFVVPGNDSRSIYDIISECTLTEEEEHRLAEHVRSRDAIFFSTPFSLAAVDRLVAMEVPLIKIGSGECGNFPLLEKVASTGLPVILSTGMNTRETIRSAVKILSQSQADLAILQATNLYPSPAHVLNLGAITELREMFPENLVGYSDHTTSNVAAIAAMALGARIIERHFTDSKHRVGPDIVCSMDPAELRDLLAAAEFLASALPGGKEVNDAEDVTRAFAFSSLVATTLIPAGATVQADNTVFKRPSGGDFHPGNLNEALNRTARVEIPPNVQLKKDWLV